MENKLCGRVGQLLCVHGKCSKELVGTELWVGSRGSYRDVSAKWLLESVKEQDDVWDKGK